jgi:ABC-type glutathione transport system ATPase component
MSDTLPSDNARPFPPEAAMADDVLVRVDNLVKHFPVHGGGLIRRVIGQVQAVEGVSLVVRRGETLGLVGETWLRQVHPGPLHRWADPGHLGHRHVRRP